MPTSVDKKAAEKWKKKWQPKYTENIEKIRVGKDGTVIGLKREWFGEPPNLSWRLHLVRWDGNAWQPMHSFDKNMDTSDMAVIDKDNIWIVIGKGPSFMYPYQWNPKKKKFIRKNKLTVSSGPNSLAVTEDGKIFVSVTKPQEDGPGRTRETYKWIGKTKR